MKRKDKAPLCSQEQAAFCFLGVTALRKHVRNLAREVRGVQNSDDPECIHRMRVALRRLRSVLPLFATCVPGKQQRRWQKTLRQTARALGAIRDTDVQIAFVRTYLHTLEEERVRPGVARLLLRLQQRRQHLRKPMLVALKALEERRLIVKMQRFLRALAEALQNHYETTPTLPVYNQVGALLEEQLGAVQTSAALITTLHQSAEVHALRIAIKRLRYTMQAFVPLYHGALQEAIKLASTLQEVLGDLHDSDVWLQYLPRFQEEEQARTIEYFGTLEPFATFVPGFVTLEEYCQQRRSHAWQTFTALWHQESTRHGWHTLAQAVLAAGTPAPLEDVAERAPSTLSAESPLAATRTPAPVLPPEVLQKEDQLRACRDAWRWHATGLLAAIPAGCLMAYSDFALWVNQTYHLRLNASNIAWLRGYLYTLLGDATTLPLHRLARKGDVHSVQEPEALQAFSHRLRAAEGTLTQPMWWRPS